VPPAAEKNSAERESPYDLFIRASYARLIWTVKESDACGFFKRRARGLYFQQVKREILQAVKELQRESELSDLACFKRVLNGLKRYYCSRWHFLFIRRKNIVAHRTLHAGGSHLLRFCFLISLPDVSLSGGQHLFQGPRPGS